MPKLKDLTGQRFGRLIVQNREGTLPDGRVTWNCVCDCGNTGTYVGKQLRIGERKSCGCLKSQLDAERVTHGQSHLGKGHGSRAYVIWRGLIARCHNPNSKDYPRYGGRGISVADSWRSSFETFLQDLGDAPDGMQIDRINNNGNYEPGNCRWATPTEQARNKRSNRFLTYGDKTLCLSEWAEVTGIPSDVIKKRLDDSKWDVHRTLTTPVRKLSNNRKSA